MQNKNRIPSIFAFSLILTLLLVIFLADPGVSAAGENAVVSVNVANIRSGPGTGNAVTGQVAQGDSLPVLGQTDGWYRVQTPDGGSGWVAGWLVAVNTSGTTNTPVVPSQGQSQGPRQVAMVTGSVVNIRSGPGTGNAVTGQVTQGDNLTVLGQSDGWYHVSTLGGGTGWIAGWLVAVNTSGTTNTPVVPSPGQSQSPRQVAMVTGSVVNIRSGPGTGNAVTGQVTQGDNLTVLGQSDGWYQVGMPGGGTGWIAGWLVSVQTAPSMEPATPAEPAKPGQTPAGQNTGSGNPSSPSGRALSLNVNQSGGKTNISVRASAPIEYTSFFLNNPDRLVLDLKGIVPGDLPTGKTVNSGTVKQIRVGYYQRNPDITRLVIELSGGPQFEASLSSDRKTLNVQTFIPDLNGVYRNMVIAIDAGHGGSETGAIGKNGTREKDVNLNVAKRVARLLEAKGAKVIMTRSGDSYTGLYERTDKANNAKTDVFVSIHMNANEDRSISGTSTYIYSGSGSARENARIEESNRLARYIQAELLKSLNLRDAGIRNANFAVLRTSDMPAVLAEVAFISNAAEEKLMGTDNFCNKAAEAIVRGIGMYFAEKRTA
ncbi:MAG: N-acetylmuramoyl-L-alanine amidase AmiC precursor [Pelotomaculum sp. PtaB.Bin104]|nr:MAG: N-acetylmuramoyl-L-alanine amidase AmiC precursor [Pelotomaculum sp. PtaB.Bin104]